MQELLLGSKPHFSRITLERESLVLIYQAVVVWKACNCWPTTEKRVVKFITGWTKMCPWFNWGERYPDSWTAGLYHSPTSSSAVWGDTSVQWAAAWASVCNACKSPILSYFRWADIRSSPSHQNSLCRLWYNIVYKPVYISCTFWEKVNHIYIPRLFICSLSISLSFLALLFTVQSYAGCMPRDLSPECQSHWRVTQHTPTYLQSPSHFFSPALNSHFSNSTSLPTHSPPSHSPLLTHGTNLTIHHQ